MNVSLALYTPISLMCGFSVYDGRGFSFLGHRYRINSVGLSILKFLYEVVQAGTRCDHERGWLLRFRGDFRKILRIRPAALLSYLCQQTTHEGMRRLAVWLRGRCGGTLGTIAVAVHRKSPSWKVRKEVARALQRMHGWEWLRDMEAADTSLRIRRLASQRAPGSFDNRMQRFLQSRSVVPHSDTPMEYFVDESVDLEVTRPKSPNLIRAILERIRRLLRGAG